MLEPRLHVPALGEVPPILLISPKTGQLGDILASNPMGLVPLKRLCTSSHPQLGKETPICYHGWQCLSARCSSWASLHAVTVRLTLLLSSSSVENQDIDCIISI